VARRQPSSSSSRGGAFSFTPLEGAALFYFGQCVGMAVRCGMALPLSLPRHAWEAIATGGGAGEGGASAGGGGGGTVAAGFGMLREGMCCVVPQHALPLLSAAELEQLVCGRAPISLGALRRALVLSVGFEEAERGAAEQREGVHRHVHTRRWFWGALAAMAAPRRAACLRWAVGVAREEPLPLVQHAVTAASAAAAAAAAAIAAGGGHAGSAAPGAPPALPPFSLRLVAVDAPSVDDGALPAAESALLRDGRVNYTLRLPPYSSQRAMAFALERAAAGAV